MPSLRLLSATIASAARGFAGSKVADKLGPRPARPLELYEFEACPFCRKVREMITWLDLEVVVYPCPKGGKRYRPQVVDRGGKAQFPYLVDPNTNTEMYESDAIIAYLAQQYGTGQLPTSLRLGPATFVSAAISSWLRPAGTFAVDSGLPEQPLVLRGYEGSPASRLVREDLCRRELPYLLQPNAPGSSRPTTAKPQLRDPNTGIEVAGADRISAYLGETYGGH